MDQWKGKVAVVTGASSGIGATICKDLCQAGIIVVGLARRLDRLEKLKSDILAVKKDALFYEAKCDLTKEEDIQAAFKMVISLLGSVDILVNNAGVITYGSVLDDSVNLETMKRAMDTNLMGLISCTKKAFKSMADRDVPGYIINISSVAGHAVPNVPGVKPMFNIYPSTKHGLKAFCTVIRHELNFMKKTQIRVSNISPGAVRTELFEAGGISLDTFGDDLPLLEPEDVSNTVLYLLGTNPRIQIEDVIIRPIGESF